MGWQLISVSQNTATTIVLCYKPSLNFCNCFQIERVIGRVGKCWDAHPHSQHGCVYIISRYKACHHPKQFLDPSDICYIPSHIQLFLSMTFIASHIPNLTTSFNSQLSPSYLAVNHSSHIHWPQLNICITHRYAWMSMVAGSLREGRETPARPDHFISHFVGSCATIMTCLGSLGQHLPLKLSIQLYQHLGKRPCSRTLEIHFLAILSSTLRVSAKTLLKTWTLHSHSNWRHKSVLQFEKNSLTIFNPFISVLDSQYTHVWFLKKSVVEHSFKTKTLFSIEVYVSLSN